MRLWVGAVALAMLAPSVAAAGEYTIGPDGAFYCLEADAFIAVLKDASKGEVFKRRPGCGAILPGAKGQARDVSRSGTLESGVVSIPAVEAGKEVYFITPAPAASASSDAPQVPNSGRIYKAVAPADVAATPTKWQWRDIEFRGVNVYWVADDDVRFVTSARMTVFARNVRGPDVDFLRQSCETQKEALSARCRVSIRFSYGRFSEDRPDGYSTRLVLDSSDVAVSRERGARR